MTTRRQNLVELSLIVLAVAGTLIWFCSMAVTGPEAFLNPHPANTYVYGGVSRAIPAWLGVADFPRLFQNLTLPTTLLLWGWFLWRSWREGRMHPAILVMVAITVVAILMEPLINWGMYLNFDTRAPHFPIDTPWMRIAPNVEPMSCFYGYPYYFLLPALLAAAIYRRLSRHAPDTSWWRRHPLSSLALLGWLTGMVFDFLVELAILRAGLYTYSQVWPVISIDVGKAWQFPALMAVPTIAATMSMSAVLLHRDANGCNVADNLTARVPGLRRIPTFGAVIVASLMCCLTYGIYTGAFVAQRMMGLATSITQPWPFEEHMIYDPDGLFEQHGVPGPFFDDNGPRTTTRR